MLNVPFKDFLFHRFVSLSCNLHVTLVCVLSSKIAIKKEDPLVVGRSGGLTVICPVVPVDCADQAAGNGVSLFEEPLEASRPRLARPPSDRWAFVELSSSPDASWASSSVTTTPTAVTPSALRYLRAVLPSEMADASSTATSVGHASLTDAPTSSSASITTSPFPTSSPPFSESSLASPSPTASGSSEALTSRQPLSTTTTSASTHSSVSRRSVELTTSAPPSSTAASSDVSPTETSSSVLQSSSSQSSSVASDSASASVTAPPSGSSPSPSSSSTRSISFSESMSISVSPGPSSSSVALSSSEAPSPSNPAGPTSTPQDSSIAASSTKNSSSLLFPSGSTSRSPTFSRSRTSSISRTPTSTPRTTVPPPIAVITTVLTINTPAASSTGILRPGENATSGFANNTGAIVGVSVTAAVALILSVFFLFFCCKKYRARRSHNESTDRILALARDLSWRKPLDGSDNGSYYNEKVFYNKSGAASPPREFSRDHSSDGHRDGNDGTSQSHETARPTTIQRPMNPALSWQPYAPIAGSVQRPNPAALSAQQDYPFANIQDSSPAWRTADPFEHENDPFAARNTLSLTNPRRYSTGQDIVTHSAPGSWGPANDPSRSRTRKSISGPHELYGVSQKEKKHNSTPPSAFLGTHDDTRECEWRQTSAHNTQAQADRRSVKSIMGKIRRLSTYSIASTIRGAPGPFSEFADPEDQLPIPTTSLIPTGPPPASPGYIYSPSLLNPPIELMTPQPLLCFPRGVTGRSYDRHSAVVLWPPATLPPSAPVSPTPTDDSSMIEGLLHPKLALDGSRQASQTSLRDHEDYTRPINGLIRNRYLKSTATLNGPAHEVVGSEDGASSIWRDEV